MVPLVDMHCHLLAGLDDGPRSMEAALEMCAMAYADGTRLMAATAHQNARWKDVTPERIHQATHALTKALRDRGSPMKVFPCAEVMAQPHTGRRWRERQLLSVANRDEYLLLEMPRGLFVDLIPTVRSLRKAGIRPILAHPEREPEYLHEPDLIDAMIEAGCLVQVSSSSITEPKNEADRRALKAWFRRRIVHLLGSDGHSPKKRLPLLSAAYQQVVRWAGIDQADRIASSNGMAIAHGLPLRIPRPLARATASWWFLSMW
jgi:protein-tyrosine phosphatase